MTQMKIKVFKEDIHFSVAHFTMFSDTERERIHGHNYSVSAELTCSDDLINGLSFDYKIIKAIMRNMCTELDEYFLIPAHSPHIQIEENETQILIYYGKELISLPMKDVKILPLTNITCEELCHWFLQKILLEIKNLNVETLKVSVMSGPGQSVELEWRKNETTDHHGSQ